jgi:hypothetical protein
MRSPAERQAARDALLAEILRKEATAVVVLRAVGTVGGVPVAMVDVNDEPRVVMLYSELAGQVVEIDVPQGQVTVQSRNGSLRIHKLTEPRPVKFPEVTSDPEQQEKMMGTPDYVRLRRQGVPSEVVLTWNTLNREAKEAILLSYLQLGLVVRISQGEISVGQLFEQQMFQRSQERMRAFVASLSPEQEAWFRGSAVGLVRMDAPPEKLAAQAEKNRQTGANKEKLLASLTPEQRKLYDAMRAQPAQ